MMAGKNLLLPRDVPVAEAAELLAELLLMPIARNGPATVGVHTWFT